MLMVSNSDGERLNSGERYRENAHHSSRAIDDGSKDRKIRRTRLLFARWASSENRGADNVLV